MLSFTVGFHYLQWRFPLGGKISEQQQKKWFPLARMKDFVGVDISTRRKKLPLSLNYTNYF